MCNFKNECCLIVLMTTVLLASGSCKKHVAVGPLKNTDPITVPDTVKDVASITGAVASLHFNKVGNTCYNVYIATNEGGIIYEQKKPLVVELVKSDNSVSWGDSMYTSLTANKDSIICSGNFTTGGGTVLRFVDVYKKITTEGTFTVRRNVKVIKAGTDKGFATRIGFQRSISADMTNYDFFVPSVWYRQNRYVPFNALASSMSDEFYWFREDRLPLPLFMMRDIGSGATFSVYHKDPDGATFNGEDGLSRIIDGRMKFASVGMQNRSKPLVGVTYPGSEGERTGVNGMAAANNRWAYRSHPVTSNYEQDYTVAFHLSIEKDFTTAMKNTWQRYYNLAAPPVYQCDLDRVYQDQVDLLGKYWRSVNAAPGFPFRIMLDGTAADADYNYNMGFVGMEIPDAAMLIRAGLQTGDALLLSKGEQVADWWAKNAVNPANGSIRTWYDPEPGTWRGSYPTFMRVIGDGMRGLLWAWDFEQKAGISKDAWFNTCIQAGDWLVTKQSTDGSFPRSVDFITNLVTDAATTNTSHVLPFLVELYFASHKESYRQAALKAGDFLYRDSYLNFKYIGGTPDNPNVPDKEAASMALRAYLALYDLSKDTKWLEAAQQAGYYYQTWIYAWNVPIPKDDAGATYPKDRSTTGLSVIGSAGNAADSYASIDAFQFYRLYLYTNDRQFFTTAQLCLYNTKQAVNWDRAHPIPGYGDPGILVEAMNVTIPRGHSVNYYLPWQAYNFLEPMVLFKEVFGDMDLEHIEKMSNRTSLNEAYSMKRGF